MGKTMSVAKNGTKVQSAVKKQLKAGTGIVEQQQQHNPKPRPGKNIQIDELFLNISLIFSFQFNQNMFQVAKKYKNSTKLILNLVKDWKMCLWLLKIR